MSDQERNPVTLIAGLLLPVVVLVGLSEFIGLTDFFSLTSYLLFFMGLGIGLGIASRFY